MMMLFIDRLPFRFANQDDRIQSSAVMLPIIPADPGQKFNTSSIPRPYRWRLDTGCTSFGLAWRMDLLEAGLSPDRFVRKVEPLRATSGMLVSDTARRIELFLVSNIPALVDQPFRISLQGGIHVGPSGRPPATHFPIIGQAALLHAGVKLNLDYRRRTVSVWVPSSRIQSIGSVVRRAVRIQPPPRVRWQDD